MTIRVAINGYGRIGRNVLRALYEYNRTDEIKIVAINDLGDVNTNVHLTKFDTTHGRFNADVEMQDDTMLVNGDKIKVFAIRNPEQLPWKELEIDVVMECTGIFRTKETASMHITAGAKKVLLSAPGNGEVDA
ncbi:MAG TPA: erythrose-4-phosphate dehydrogenase, partial [Saprospiraceae bacterium]|nr:erythrose-4-phosphate dehydrogenase [Saprospiraceae bacterium]